MNGILATILGGTEAIVYYPGGRCYYTVPIRHFNDDEVKLYTNPNATGEKNYAEFPIGSGTKVTVNSINQEGRYGIVRNHWYSVNINSISQIGLPDTGGELLPPDENDDVENLYLNAKINILPWARRNQSADI